MRLLDGYAAKWEGRDVKEQTHWNKKQSHCRLQQKIEFQIKIAYGFGWKYPI
jgi:hypothetical protein